jgi:RNA polymerase sigma-70 factor (ECF subfamily)
MTAASGEAMALAALRGGDEAAFGALAERYRYQLRVHIYRMLGSFDEAEDLVQETLLRAWRGRAGFEGRSLFRTWLYRIATNLCLNALERAPRRILPADIAPPVAFDGSTEARTEPPWAPELPWMQPFPDALLEPVAPRESEPDAVVVTRETIELAYLTAVQHLPPRQRAILVLRDALEWSAAETAELLETSVASVNSALQRARATMRSLQPSGSQGLQHSANQSLQPSSSQGLQHSANQSLQPSASQGARPSASQGAQPSASRDRATAVGATEQERAVLRRFMDAWEQADTDMLTQLLREDARMAMPPAPLWFDGRASIARLFELFPIGWQGDFRMVATSANRQPAAAAYLRKHGETTFGLTALLVLRIEAGAIAEIMTFSPALVHGFDLPAVLTD